MWQGAACGPGLRRDRGAFLAGKRGSRLRRRLGRVWDGHDNLGADWGYFVSRIWRFFCEVFRPDGLFPSSLLPCLLSTNIRLHNPPGDVTQPARRVLRHLMASEELFVCTLDKLFIETSYPQ